MASDMLRRRWQRANRTFLGLGSIEQRPKLASELLLRGIRINRLVRFGDSKPAVIESESLRPSRRVLNPDDTCALVRVRVLDDVKPVSFPLFAGPFELGVRQSHGPVVQ